MIATFRRIVRRADRIAVAGLHALIRTWQLAISPLLGAHCRFEPSCSRYASEAISRHGAGTGVLLGAKRLARCHPFHPGGFDPVPGTTRDSVAPLGRRPH